MTDKRTGRGRGWLAGVGAMVLITGGGCLQILGDDGTFVLGTGGAGGESGGAGPGGNGGGTAGAGATGGSGGTTTTGVCLPGETRNCYSGPDGTEGVGECKAGVETCAGDGSGWGECQGEVTPKTEDPMVVGDEACDGYLAGEHIWSQLFGGTGSQRGFSIATSPLDNAIHVTGMFEDAFQLGSETLQPIAVDTGFLAKFDSGGNPLWTKLLPLQNQFVPPVVATGPTGSTVLTARLSSPIALGARPVGPGMIIAKFDAQGQHIWSVTCGGGEDTAGLWSADTGAEVVVWGSFDGTIDCGGQPHTSIGPHDLFLAKLDGSTGTIEWTKRFGSGNDHGAGGVALDTAGNILVTGTLTGPGFTDFGNGGITEPDGSGAFVLKLDATGSTQWIYKILGVGDQTAGFIAISPDGAATVSGQFDTTAELPGGETLTGDAANKNIFLVQINAGNGTNWAKAFSGAANGIQLPSLAVTEGGDIVLAGGIIDGAIDLGGGPLMSSAVFEGIIARLSGADGAHIWSRTFGNVGLTSLLSVDGNGHIVITGTASGQLDFGDHPLISSGNDIFLAKIAP